MNQYTSSTYNNFVSVLFFRSWFALNSLFYKSVHIVHIFSEIGGEWVCAVYMIINRKLYHDAYLSFSSRMYILKIRVLYVLIQEKPP